MMTMQTLFKIFMMIAFASLTAFSQANNLAVAKVVKGSVLRSVGKDGPKQPLTAAAVIAAGDRVQTAEDGRAVVRFLVDKTFLEIKPKTILEFLLKKDGQKEIRNILLDIGQLSLGLKKQKVPFEVETSTTVASVRGTRWSIEVNDKGLSTIVVAEGAVEIYNKLTGEKKILEAGQKAISGQAGIQILPASPEDLQTVRQAQNNLQMQFIDPETKESQTLELDYESP